MNLMEIMISIIKLKGNAKKSRTAVGKIQQKKLNKLLEYAYHHSEYYKKVFEENGINEENISSIPFSKFPTIDKKLLMEHYDEIVTDKMVTQEKLRQFDQEENKTSRFLGKYHILHSSGSTGEPKYFLYDESAWNIMIAGILRAALYDVSWRQFFHWYMESPKILFLAATNGRYGGVMAVTDGMSAIKVKQLSLDIGLPVNEWIKQILEFQPNFIVGYPSAIKILGETMQKRNLKLSVKRVFSCGEPLSTGLRDYLESCFSCSVVNIYGASESLAIGTEVSKEDGMILFDDLNMIEVVNGEMYLTCLYNYTQPIIRYKMSDRLEIMEKDSENAFTKTKVLLSRDEDVLWFQNKKEEQEFLHPLSVEGFCINGLIDYQFIQINRSAFKILLELHKEAKKEKIQERIKRQILDLLKEKGLDNISFDIAIVPSIPIDKVTGKKRLMIRMEDLDENTL